MNDKVRLSPQTSFLSVLLGLQSSAAGSFDPNGFPTALGTGELSQGGAGRDSRAHTACYSVVLFLVLHSWLLSALPCRE